MDNDLYFTVVARGQFNLFSFHIVLSLIRGGIKLSRDLIRIVSKVLCLIVMYLVQFFTRYIFVCTITHLSVISIFRRSVNSKLSQVMP